MLTHLSVRNFAVVEAAEIEFGAWLTVVTGETGAGKSLLVDALLLLSGARADAGMVRAGCERAELAAEFEFVVDAAQYLQIKPAVGDVIRYIHMEEYQRDAYVHANDNWSSRYAATSCDSGHVLRCNVPGAAIRIVATSPGIWTVMSHQGLWSVSV